MEVAQLHVEIASPGAVQRSAKVWLMGCMNSPHVVGGSRNLGTVLSPSPVISLIQCLANVITSFINSALSIGCGNSAFPYCEWVKTYGLCGLPNMGTRLCRLTCGVCSENDWTNDERINSH